MNTKKYIIIAGLAIAILGGVFTLTLAAMNYFYPQATVVKTGNNENTLIRETNNGIKNSGSFGSICTGDSQCQSNLHCYVNHPAGSMVGILATSANPGTCQYNLR